MKKIFVFTLATLFVAFSCTKEENFTSVDEQQAQEENVTPEETPVDDVELVPFSFGVTETKTYIDDSGSPVTVAWEDGESIAVYDGTAIREFTMTSRSPLKFEGEIAADATFAWAVYPYNATGISATASNVTAVLPAAQALSSHTVAEGALLTAGKINLESKTVTLLTLHGLVSFQVAHDDIAELSIKGTNLAGSATFTEGGSVSSVASPESEIVLTPNGEAFTKGDKVYIAALPGASITAVSAKRTDGYKATKTLAGKTLARNKGLSTGEFDNMALEWVYEASNADELLAWHAGHTDAAMTAAEADYPNATNHKLLLTGDIDMSGKTWGPKSLYCEFDGAGHKIYNLVIERAGASSNSNGAAFFTAVDANIHDIIFGSADGSSYDGTSYIKNTVTEDNSNWQYACVFQSVSSGVTTVISNITNFIPVSNTDAGVGKFRYGAILGYSGNADSHITISNCKNYGDVTDYSTANSTDNNIIGGIVGIFSTNAGAEITIEGCENYGTVHSVQPKTMSMGGILGRTGAGATTKLLINDCHNYGDVTYAPATYSTTILRVGGIVGDSRMADASYLDGSEYRHVISNCTVGYKPVPAGKTQTEINVTGKAFTVGGVTGWLAGTDLSSCSNYANVTGTAGAQASVTSTPVGGIAGTVGYANPYENDSTKETAATAKVNGCRNEGTVSATLNIQNNGGNSGGGGAVAGGIAGCAKGYAEFKNNINTGNVTCDNTNSYVSGDGKTKITYSYTGGIAGYIYNTHDVATPKFSGNKNSGTITSIKSNSTGKSMVAGGVVGKLVGSITDCYNYGTVSGSDNLAGAIVGMIRPNAAAHQLIITDCVVGQGVKVHGVTVTADNAGITPTGYDQGNTYTWDGSTLKITGYVGYNTTAEGKYTGLFFGQCNSSGSGTATLSGASTVATAPTL